MRQQLLYLWLAESALDTEVVAWAVYDGAKGDGPELPSSNGSGDPPYATGLEALERGWRLLQAPQAGPLPGGTEPLPGELQFQLIFERWVALGS